MSITLHVERRGIFFLNGAQNAVWWFIFWSVLRNSVKWAIFKLFHVIRACGSLVHSQHVSVQENTHYFQLCICHQQKETGKAIWPCLAPVWHTTASRKSLNKSIAPSQVTWSLCAHVHTCKVIYKAYYYCVSSQKSKWCNVKTFWNTEKEMYLIHKKENKLL